jgi:hypothetical protein
MLSAKSADCLNFDGDWRRCKGRAELLGSMGRIAGMKRWKLTLCAALACGLAAPGCFSVSLQRRCIDCGGPMDGCESTCAEEAVCERPDEGLPERIGLLARVQCKCAACLATIRGYYMREPGPLAPPPARYHPVPTRPVFFPVCDDESPPAAPLDAAPTPEELPPLEP